MKCACVRDIWRHVMFMEKSPLTIFGGPESLPDGILAQFP